MASTDYSMISSEQFKKAMQSWNDELQKLQEAAVRIEVNAEAAFLRAVESKKPIPALKEILKAQTIEQVDTVVEDFLYIVEKAIDGATFHEKLTKADYDLVCQICDDIIYVKIESLFVKITAHEHEGYFSRDDFMHSRQMIGQQIVANQKFQELHRGDFF